jgi:hypothetical protein
MTNQNVGIPGTPPITLSEAIEKVLSTALRIKEKVGLPQQESTAKSEPMCRNKLVGYRELLGVIESILAEVEEVVSLL